MNDHILNDYALSLAEEIKTEIEDFDNCDAVTLAWERADGSEHVIYHYKAHDICQNCDITHGENYMEECFDNRFKSFDDTAVTIAFGELHYRILSKLSDLGVEV
tara:strand:- start:376 stop:687 length:312 start_codon:yes stop_codon:yes gene_type:complete